SRGCGIHVPVVEHGKHERATLAVQDREDLFGTHRHRLNGGALRDSTVATIRTERERSMNELRSRKGSPRLELCPIPRDARRIADGHVDPLLGIDIESK